MKYAICILAMLLVVVGALAQDVQISTERDENGKFTNPADLQVTWDTTPVASIGDHNAVENDTAQEWYVPVTGGFLKFTFTRSELGEYAVRWRPSSEAIWSEWAAVTIEQPATPVHP